MKTTLVALGAVLGAAASLIGTAALAQSASNGAADQQAQADYQAKQAQYQDQKALYDAQQAQYQDKKNAYHQELAQWAAGQEWPERYRGDHYVVTDWGIVHLHDPGAGYRWYRDENGDYVRVDDGTHVIAEVYPR
jgi:Ni/Co efflux regulator RcnB